MTSPTYQPLKGIRVLSFELAFALPAGTRALADLGAEVVRVGRPEINAFGNYISVVDGVFHGKPAIAIDLKTPRGRKLAWDLAQQADIVANNYRPGVMEKYGLSAELLKAAKPTMICLQLSGYGTPGPWSGFPAYGPSTEAAGGLNRLLVNEGEVPIRIGSGVFSDQLSGRYAAMAILGALVRRKRFGEGATIDMAMTGGISHLLGPLMVQAARDKQMPAAEQNRDKRYVPQGVYACEGEDEWVAISVKSDEAWKKLSQIIGDDRLKEDATFSERRDQHDDLDLVIAEWCASRNKNEIAIQLQSQQVAAAPVRTVADTLSDPQFKARGTLQDVTHRKPLLGARSHPHPPLPWRIAGRKRKRLRDYRTAGTDNGRILSSWLGMSVEEISELTGNGILFYEGPLELDTGVVIDDLADPNFDKKSGSKQ